MINVFPGTVEPTRITESRAVPAAVGQADAVPAGVIDVHPAPRRPMARPPPRFAEQGLRFIGIGSDATLRHLTGNTPSTPSKTQNPPGPTAGTG